MGRRPIHAGAKMSRYNNEDHYKHANMPLKSTHRRQHKPPLRGGHVGRSRGGYVAVRPGTRLRLRGATHLDRPWEMPTCFVALGASFTTQMAHKNSQAPHFTLMFTPGKAPNSSRSMAHSKVGMASPVVLRHMRLSRKSAKSGLKT